MADVVDRADDESEMFLKDAMNRHNKAGIRSLKSIGICHYCDTTVSRGMLFCEGVECRNDWEAEDEILRKQGIR